MIIKMTHSNRSDYNASNEGFIVSGRIVAKYEHDQWTYTEEKLSKPYLKQYEDEDIDSAYIQDH